MMSIISKYDFGTYLMHAAEVVNDRRSTGPIIIMNDLTIVSKRQQKLMIQRIIYRVNHTMGSNHKLVNTISHESTYFRIS